MTKIGSPLIHHCQFADRDVAEGRRHLPVIAADAIDLHPDLDVHPRLATVTPGPPAGGLVHEDRHGEGGAPAREVHLGRGLGEHATALVGDDRDQTGFGGRWLRPWVEVHVHRQAPPLLGGFGADDPEPRDADGPGVTDVDRAPDPARVPIGVEVVPVREDAGDRPLAAPVGLTRVRDLDGERSARTWARGEGGDLERVGGEVALGRAEVVAVEPDVAEVEDAVETSGTAGGRRPTASVRAVAGRARDRRCPRTAGSNASGPGPATSGQSPSVKPGSVNRRARSPSVHVGSPPTRQVDGRRVGGANMRNRDYGSARPADGPRGPGRRRRHSR